MAIPDYQTLMLPVLQLLGDGQEHLLRDIVQKLSDQFGLSEEERRHLLPSGVSTTMGSRIGWAKTYLHKARLLNLTGRGRLQISSRGTSVLQRPPEKINVAFLKQFPEFVEFQSPSKNGELDKTSEQTAQNSLEEPLAPDEALDSAYKQLQADLESQLLDKMKSMSPESFERLVVEVLVKMGYGGTLEDAGKAVGKSHDEGIDGVIKEDRLGFDQIYIQAKKWSDSPVGRPEIQKFVGALQPHRARKGVFITTSTFTKDAEDFVKRIETKVILINGFQLAKMMIDLNVGVSISRAYQIKKIDSDYFEEE
ncbi:MAG: restriction endonuclease [Acidobacteria bacterium]|nr:restriction endonuclease [Acidobacteriota bacterium]